MAKAITTSGNCETAKLRRGTVSGLASGKVAGVFARSFANHRSRIGAPELAVEASESKERQG